MQEIAEHAGTCLGGYTKSEQYAVDEFARNAASWVPSLVEEVRTLRMLIEKLKKSPLRILQVPIE